MEEKRYLLRDSQINLLNTPQVRYSHGASHNTAFQHGMAFLTCMVFLLHKTP